MTTPKRWVRVLSATGACEEAVDYAEGFPTFAAAWRECPRGDWMLWILGRMSGDPGSDARRPLVLAACECARLALSVFEKKYPTDKRPRVAIETAERWALGGDGAPSLGDVRTAAYTASAAAASAASYAAADAAAYAADAAAYAASYAAANAANAANADACAAAYAAAYARVLSECADIVRKRYRKPPSRPSPSPRSPSSRPGLVDAHRTVW